MSLDLVLIGENGRPECTVPVRVDIHDELITAASSLDLKKLMKLKDYYGDALYQIEELEDLNREILVLLQQSTSEELRIILYGFEQLIGLALARSSSIEAIAD
jgi:hypothetical protein